MLANGGELEGRQFFTQTTIELDDNDAWLPASIAVFQIPTAFSAGFMKDPPGTSRTNFRTIATLSFGHPGAGGSHAFADPENKISFAYVMNQMEQSLLPNEKSLRLSVDAIYRYTSGATVSGPSTSPITVTTIFRRVRCAAMFEQKNSLPRPELHFTIDDRNHFVRAR